MNSTNRLILHEAEKLFIQKGLMKTSIHEIARACNLVVASLYHYYGNKEEILFAILGDRLKKNLEGLAEHLAGISDPISKLEKYIWFQFHFSEKDPGYSKLILLELRHYPDLPKIPPYQYMKEIVNHLVPILREGQKQGLFEEDLDSITFRNMVWGTLEAFTRNWLIFGQPKNITEFAPIVTRRILSGITGPSLREKLHWTATQKARAFDLATRTSIR